MSRRYLQDDGVAGKRPETKPSEQNWDFDLARVGRTLLSVAFDFDLDRVEASQNQP